MVLRSIWSTAHIWGNVLGTALIGLWGLELAGQAAPSKTEVWVARAIGILGMACYALSLILGHRRSAKVRELEDELNNATAARSVVEANLSGLLRASTEGLRARLGSMAGELGMNSSGRISLFSYQDHEDKRFVLRARYSLDPEWGAPGRTVLPGARGLIAEAFRADRPTRWTVTPDRSKTGQRRQVWEGEMRRLGNGAKLSSAEIRTMRMTSNLYLFCPLRLPADDRLVGIVVAEHLASNGIAFKPFTELMKHRAREFSLALLAVIEATADDVSPEEDAL